MKYTDEVTRRLNAKIPRCAIDLRFEDTGVLYMHPRKGWKRVSYKRMGLRFDGWPKEAQ